jgi:hypothetical protein
MAPPRKTKQWTTGLDGLENLQLREAELPSLKDGEVLVKISAVSLNYRDTEGASVTHLSRAFDQCCEWVESVWLTDDPQSAWVSTAITSLSHQATMKNLPV